MFSLKMLISIVLLAYCLLKSTNGEKKRSCYKSRAFMQMKKGHTEIKTVVLDGFNGSCVRAVFHNLSAANAISFCMSNFDNGRLMTKENIQSLFNELSHVESKLWKTVKDGWFFANLTNDDVCWMIRFGKNSLENRTVSKIKCLVEHYFLCQYPYQYECSFKESLKEEAFNSRCAVEYELSWQRSDADPTKNCSKNDRNASASETLTCSNDGTIAWSEWLNCSAPCNGVTFRNRCQVCDGHYHKLNESKSCNTNVECPKPIQSTDTDDNVSVETTRSSTHPNEALGLVTRKEGEGILNSDFAFGIIGMLCILGLIFVFSAVAVYFCDKKDSQKQQTRKAGSSGKHSTSGSNRDVTASQSCLVKKTSSSNISPMLLAKSGTPSPTTSTKIL